MRWLRLRLPVDVGVEPLSAVIAEDPATGRTLLVDVEFQGTAGAAEGGTWVWDGHAWTERHSVPGVVGAFDVTQPLPARDPGLVLIGGPQDAGAYRQVWAWDGSAWRRTR